MEGIIGFFIGFVVALICAFAGINRAFEEMEEEHKINNQ